MVTSWILSIYTVCNYFKGWGFPVLVAGQICCSWCFFVIWLFKLLSEINQNIKLCSQMTAVIAMYSQLCLSWIYVKSQRSIFKIHIPFSLFSIAFDPPSCESKFLKVKAISSVPVDSTNAELTAVARFKWVTRHILRRQLLWHWYLSEDRVRLMGMIGFLVQGRVRIRIRVRDRVRVYVSFNISISCLSICRRSICHGTFKWLSYLIVWWKLLTCCYTQFHGFCSHFFIHVRVL